MVVWHALRIAVSVVVRGNAINAVFAYRECYGISGIIYPGTCQCPAFIQLVRSHYGQVVRSVLARIVPLMVVDLVNLFFAFGKCITDPAGKPACFLFQQSFQAIRPADTE